MYLEPKNCETIEMTTICQMFNTIKKLSQEMVADAAKPLNKKTNIKSSSEKEEPIVLINEDIFETDSESEEEEEVEVLEENIEEEEEEDVEVLEEEDVEAVEEYEDVEVLEDQDIESAGEEEEEVEVLEEQPIPESPPRRRGGNGNRERKRTPANMDIRQYDRLEMILGGETWWIECYSEDDFGAFEVIDAPYRRDIEGYIFRKGDRYGGERKIISPINFIFQQFVESAGIPRQKRTPWTCIYKWRDGVSTKLNWI